MTADQCACRQAERDNLVGELVEALEWASSALQAAAKGTRQVYEKDTIARMDRCIPQIMTIEKILDQADDVLARAKEQQQ